METSTSALADRRAHVAEVRQLARGAVERRTRRLAVVALLEPARGERHQVGEDELGVLALRRGSRAGSRARSRTSAAQPSSSRRSRSTKPNGAQARDGRAACAARRRRRCRRDRRRRARRARGRDEQRRREVRDDVGAHGVSRRHVADRRVDAVRRGRVATRRGSRARSPTTGANPRCAAATASTPLPAAPVDQRASAAAPAAAPGTAAWSGATPARTTGPGRSTSPSPAREPRRADRERADRDRRQVLVPGRLPARRRPACATTETTRPGQRTQLVVRGSVVAVDHELDAVVRASTSSHPAASSGSSRANAISASSARTRMPSRITRPAPA